MAYNACVIRSKDLRPDGTEQLIVDFTGVGAPSEPPIRREISVTPGMTLADLSDWANTVAGQLNTQKAVVVALPAVGAQISLTPKPADPGPTAQDLWVADAKRLVRMQAIVDAGGLDPANAELVALRTSVKNGYQAAYAGAI